MGGGNSKSEPPKAVQQVNVMITKEVTERWEAMRLQHLEKDRKNDKMEQESSPKSTSDKVGVKIEMGRQTETELNKLMGNPDSESQKVSSNATDLPSLKSEDNQPVSMQQTTLPESVSGKSKEDVVRNYDNMDKFTNFFVPRTSWKLRHDLENGSDVQDQYMNSETRHSGFLRKPTTDDDSDRTVYEEVDETAEEKREHVDFIDEEAIIGNNAGSSVPSKSRPMIELKEVRVPQPALPVILDQDEEGKVTIETINAWKMRQRFEKEISQHNARWAGELQRITAKVEDETRRQADDFQRRIDELKQRHGDSIEPPIIGKCNLLVPQIEHCYRKNESQVLKCSELVRQFAQCTNKSG